MGRLQLWRVLLSQVSLNYLDRLQDRKELVVELLHVRSPLLQRSVHIVVRQLLVWQPERNVLAYAERVHVGWVVLAEDSHVPPDTASSVGRQR